jgi:hypothetical protein
LLQYTGLSPRGWNGTRASPPQLLQTAVNISRGPPPAPAPWLERRAARQVAHRLGGF